MTICRECKHIITATGWHLRAWNFRNFMHEVDFKKDGDMFLCEASPIREKPTNPVTGAFEFESSYELCRNVNKGDCSLFSQYVVEKAA